MTDTLIHDRYRIEAVLGRGGSGIVYRATDLALARRVALKIVNPALAAVPELIARFRREAQVLARLTHPSAVHVYDLGSDGAITYIAMELIEGQSLAQILQREGRLPAGRAVAIGAQVLDLLAAAHQIGVVHRDLKPSNLLIERRAGGEQTRVVDFGTALLLGVQAPRLTGEGRVFGTPTYMAPEQCLGRTIDARTDLYALGCTIYEMLVGQPPFDETAGTTVMMAHVHRAPVPPSKAAPDVEIPAALEAVVLRALAKLPAQRFGSAQIMLEALRASLEPPSAPASPAARRGAGARPPRAVPEAASPPPAVAAGVRVALLEGPRGVGIGTALGALGLEVTPLAPGDDVSRHALVIVAPGEDGGDGLEAAAAFAGAGRAPVLLCGPEDDLGLMARAIAAGVHDYVPLPLDATDLARKVTRALRARR